MNMIVRPATPEDGSSIGKMIYDTVRSVNRRDYSNIQVETWAPDPLIYSTYEKSIAFVVELDQRIIGFANLTHGGYIARFYVHKDFQRRGVGTLLLKALENKAKEIQIKELTTEASITAKPFFMAHGFHMKEEQTKILRNISFVNFKMFKLL